MRMKKIVFMVLLLAFICSLGFAKDVNVSLTLFEKVAILNMLPQRAKFLDVLTISDIREKVRLTPKEREDHEEYIKQIFTGLISYENENHDYSIKVTFTSAEREILNVAIKKMNKDGTVPANALFIKLYKMIRDLEPEEGK